MKYLRWTLFVISILVISACNPSTGGGKPDSMLDKNLQDLLNANNISELDFGPKQDSIKVALGRLLMYDKELSGNRDIACATCHRGTLETTDKLSLSIGTGGKGSGTNRTMGINRNRVPRNAPEVFNRGAPEWHSMFWDSRVSGDPIHGFKTPAGNLLPKGLENVLAAQAMFPVTSDDEMRGRAGDKDVNGQVNEIAAIDGTDLPAIWDAIMKRLLAIKFYERAFAKVYPNVPKSQLGFQHAANAIAAFEIDAWTTPNSPFDQYLAGNKDALSDAAKRGGILFYGKANCVACHSGNLLTDQKHHNIAAPQIGPGKGSKAPLDLGLFLETKNRADLFAFRTPPLRNVSLTGPYMHNGAYTNLEAAVRHYNNVADAVKNYDVNQLEPSLRSTVLKKYPAVFLATLDPQIKTLNLSDTEINELLAFLEALTDPVDLSLNIPKIVPSGLPVAD